MSGSINLNIRLGYLGADPEVKHIAFNKLVATIKLATHEEWTDQSGQRQKHTEWHTIKAFNKLAELCARYLRKGHLVYFEGKSHTRKYQTRDGETRYVNEMIAHCMQIIQGENNANSGRYEQEPASCQRGSQEAVNQQDYLMDLPFGSP
ncbi:MAG TPA: single-stranded DNA-binding protein [Syntrophorhabdus sp.]|jgi:single-strand DNA-binding protein|nr:single-stranded DNA-binding protein [Syntrophorhabdus sp.]